MSITVGTDSWITVEDATTYFASRWGSSGFWPASLTDAQKEAALKTAYRELLYHPDYELTASATPDSELTYAQCEQSLFIIIHQADRDRRQGIQAQGVIKAGMEKEEYRVDSGAPMIAPLARGYLDEYVRSTDYVGVVDLKRDEEYDADTEVTADNP